MFTISPQRWLVILRHVGNSHFTRRYEQLNKLYLLWFLFASLILSNDTHILWSITLWQIVCWELKSVVAVLLVSVLMAIQVCNNSTVVWKMRERCFIYERVQVIVHSLLTVCLLLQNLWWVLHIHIQPAWSYCG